MKSNFRRLVHIALFAGAANATTAVAQVDSIAPEKTAPTGTGLVAASFDEQFKAARELAVSGQHDAALTAYSNLLLLSPGNADVLLGRGLVYAWMRRWRESEVDLLSATTASPNYSDAWSALGNMYVWSEQPKLAVEAYGRWVSLNPKESAPYLARGRAHRALGDFTAARTDFETAAALGADQSEIKNDLASLTVRVQNPEAAVPSGYHWSASLTGSLTQFTHTRSNWSESTLTVRRHFDRGSLALELLNARRFDIDDQAWALDAYVNLWSRAYTNLRYQHAPQASLFPGRAWRAEIFQGVGEGWELSGSYDRLEFPGTTVNTVGIGVGKYVGDFYFRAQRLQVGGSSGASHRFLARYYYADNADDYFEFRGGSGRSDQVLASNPGLVNSVDSTSASLAWVKYWNPQWGIKIGLQYGDEGNDYIGRGVFAGLYSRW